MSLSVTSDWLRIETFVQRPVARIASFSLDQDTPDQKQERVTLRRPIQDSDLISRKNYVKHCLIVPRKDVFTILIAVHRMIIQENLWRMSYGN